MAGFGKLLETKTKTLIQIFRKIFENPEQAIIMFGGLQDAANLYASYDIRVECMVDLQGMLIFIIKLCNNDVMITYFPRNMIF